ncbi:MAG TPA: PAS domain-containing protein [Burkholderiales bacterium]|nr:PAS domain-containing protein [Burkholderiales bacterium]
MRGVANDKQKSGAFGEAVPVLFGNVGSDARMKSLNSAWESVLGYGREELHRLRLYELMPLPLHAAVTLAKQVLDTSVLGPIQFPLRTKDGVRMTFLWHRRYSPEARTMFIAGRETAEEAGGRTHRLREAPDR